MQIVDVEKCIIQNFSLIIVRLKIKAVYLLGRGQIHTWMLSTSKDKELAALIDLWPSSCEQASEFPSWIFRSFLDMLSFILRLSLCLVVSHILCGQGVKNAMFSRLGMQCFRSGRCEAERQKAEMGWLAEDKESVAGRFAQEYTWDCRCGVVFTRKDDRNLDFMIRIVNALKLVKIG